MKQRRAYMRDKARPEGPGMFNFFCRLCGQQDCIGTMQSVAGGSRVKETKAKPL